jgi:hypothetical protein
VKGDSCDCGLDIQHCSETLHWRFYFVWRYSSLDEQQRTPAGFLHNSGTIMNSLKRDEQRKARSRTIFQKLSLSTSIWSSSILPRLKMPLPQVNK